MDDRQSSSIYYIMSSFVTRCCLLIIHRKNQPVNTATSNSSFLPFPWSTSDSSEHPHDLRVCLGIKVVIFLREKTGRKKSCGHFPWHIGNHQHQPSSVVGSSSSESSAQANLSLKEMQGVKMAKLGWWDNHLLRYTHEKTSNNVGFRGPWNIHLAMLQPAWKIEKGRV